MGVTSAKQAGYQITITLLLLGRYNMRQPLPHESVTQAHGDTAGELSRQHGKLCSTQHVLVAVVFSRITQEVCSHKRPRSVQLAKVCPRSVQLAKSRRCLGTFDHAVRVELASRAGRLSQDLAKKWLSHLCMHHLGSSTYDRAILKSAHRQP